MARYEADGSLDSSFGQGGKAIGDFLVPHIITGIALQPDGKFILAGGTIGGFYIARHNQDGTLDTSFGSNGRVTNESIFGIGAFATQPDGKILVGGPSTDGVHNYFTYTLARFNPDGSQDVGFGTGGMARADFGSNGQVHSIAVQSNGKIVTAGEVSVAPNSLDFGLARFNPNGSLDQSFGAGGKLLVDFRGDFDVAFGVAVQNDGRITAGGFARDQVTGNDFALVRLKGDLTFDLCIQDESNGNLLQINTTTGEYQFTNCAGLTVGGTGLLTRRGSLITLQHNAADRRVMASIDTSTNRASASVQLFTQGRTFSITDRNIANNTCACK